MIRQRYRLPGAIGFVTVRSASFGDFEMSDEIWNCMRSNGHPFVGRRAGHRVLEILLMDLLDCFPSLQVSTEMSDKKDYLCVFQVCFMLKPLTARCHQSRQWLVNLERAWMSQVCGMLCVYCSAVFFGYMKLLVLVD